MTNHTPGPWKMVKCVCGKCNDYWIEPPGKFCQGSGFNIDDARLIAAAPELLKACKEALKTLEFLKDYEPRPRNATNRLQRTIAKAEGD